MPSYLNMHMLGFYNTRWAIIIPSLAATWYIFIIRTFIQGLPADIEESAWIDGANDIIILYKIITPLCKPAMAIVGLNLLIIYWNQYLSPILYLKDRNLYPIQVYLANIIIQNEPVTHDLARTDPFRKQALSMQFKYALIIIGIVPIICVYPFIQKYFVKGILIGSIKA